MTVKHPKQVEKFRDIHTLTKIKGETNQCPKCKHKGYFESIIQYYYAQKMYLICGWCGHIKCLGKHKNAIP